jgi:hypothetical protein
MEIELYLETAAAIIGLEVDEVFMSHGRKYVCHRLSPLICYEPRGVNLYA